MLKIVAGALDHFTKIAANDIATMEMINGSTMDLEVFPSFKSLPRSFKFRYLYKFLHTYKYTVNGLK